MHTYVVVIVSLNLSEPAANRIEEEGEVEITKKCVFFGTTSDLQIFWSIAKCKVQLSFADLSTLIIYYSVKNCFPYVRLTSM